MLHPYSHRIAISFFNFLVLTSTVSAQSISEWPEQSEVEASGFKKQFIAAFSDEPDDLYGIRSGLVKCDISNEKAGKISGIDAEVQESVYDNIPNMEADIDMDIEKLVALTTSQGCAQLKTVELKRSSNKAMKLYELPRSFTAPLLIEAKYSAELVTIMEINGDSHKSESEYEMLQQVLYLYPKKPAHPSYRQEIYNISDYKSDGLNMHTYSITYPDINESANKVILSRTEMNGEKENKITLLRKNDAGLDVVRIYGKDTVMTLIDGKMHGLMISDNYLYKTDKSVEPLSYACRNMGESISIFKITSNTDCVAVTEAQIGEKNVYVDSIYKMQRESEKQMRALEKELAQASEYREPKVVVSPVEQKRREKEAIKLKQDSHFNQLISKAKCDLENSNWVYTGSNCKKGVAHGKGSAEDRSGLKFIGTFEAGSRVKGEIHQNGEMIFSGELVDDKPSGGAICLYEGEYEECRFFRGKRIDTLYKIRIENIKNQEKIAKIQKENRTVVSQTKDSSNYMVDALEREGAKRAASFIFDKLF